MVTLICLSSVSSIQAMLDDPILDALELTEYEYDSTASSVIISDVGSSYFRFDHPVFGIELVFERTVLIKILTTDGYSWADMSIPLYKNDKYEETATVKGTTYNLHNGKVTKTKLSKSSIFREKTSNNWNHTKLTMPEVREGSVLEITYKVSSPFIFNLQSWVFQYDIPVVYSEYNTSIPEYLIYNKNLRGYHPIKQEENSTSAKSLSTGGRSGSYLSNEITYMNYDEKWVATNVPAFKEEPYLTTASNYLSAITFELASTNFPNATTKSYSATWESINSTLNEMDGFGKEMARTGFLKNLIPEIVGAATSDDEKIQNILSYFHQNVKWNGKNSLFTSGSLKDVVKEGTGNSADLNLLLIAILTETGVESYPVALSTRSHGLVFPTNPTITSFDYVIAAIPINEGFFLIDGTEPMAPLGTLPFRCLNGQGRIIDQSGGKWIDVISTPDQTKAMAEFEFDLENEQFTVKQTKKYYGFAAYSLRTDLSDNSDSEKENSNKEVSAFSVESVSIDDDNMFANEISVTSDLIAKEGFQMAGDLIYFNPLSLDTTTSNPFKLETRDYPVDFGLKSDDFFYVKFNLPAGYQVESMPEEMNILLPDRSAEYLYAISALADVVSIRSHLKINKTLFGADEYADLKNFFDIIIKKQAEQIVLKKQ